MWYNFIIKTRKVEGSRGGSLKTEFGILEMDNTFSIHDYEIFKS